MNTETVLVVMFSSLNGAKSPLVPDGTKQPTKGWAVAAAVGVTVGIATAGVSVGSSSVGVAVGSGVAVGAGVAVG